MTAEAAESVHGNLKVSRVTLRFNTPFVSAASKAIRCKVSKMRTFKRTASTYILFRKVAHLLTVRRSLTISESARYLCL